MAKLQGARADGPIAATPELIDELSDLRRRVLELERRHGEARAVEVRSAPRADGYPSLFDQLPISIWEED
jgi:hypothetical protein